MAEMPDVQTMQQLFGKKGALARTRSIHQELLEKERSGRLMREAQVATNTTFQWRTLASFNSSNDAENGRLTDWVDFGHIRFIQEPAVTTGSKAAVKGLAGDGENADEFAIYPGMGMVVAWKLDAQGRYAGARLKLFAFGDIPGGYTVVIYCVFTGPAVRVAD